MTLAVLLSTACATSRPPEKVKPQYIYMILYGGELIGYPYANSGQPEKRIKSTEIVGGMCLPLTDWEAREKYIIDLEAFAEK